MLFTKTLQYAELSAFIGRSHQRSTLPLGCLFPIIKALVILTFLLQLTECQVGDDWWTYGQEGGISGPDYWGLTNPAWSFCSKGEYQSPVDVDPQTLLYDPNLKPVYITSDAAPPGQEILSDGLLENIGQLLVFRSNATSDRVQISGGPLGAYSYDFYEIRFHFGDIANRGSEHTIGGSQFPAEVQIYGFNSKLYSTWSEAVMNTRGIVAISVMIHESEEKSSHNEELKKINSHLSKVIYKGQTAPLRVTLPEILPKTKQYVTYEGSLTAPGCQENVQWIIINKPAFISPRDLRALRSLQRTVTKPKTPLLFMTNNFRPIQPLNKRTLRTNINFKFKTAGDESICKQSIPDIKYRSNPKFPWTQPPERRNDY